ncbi:MAG TPA: D-tyrosyl-tRNA(Tyr) deacylase [Eubacteriaceae bacterium]|nr:D-tyrosyl-tRNA(Tyr) deacylase [Eubacteriaceae bacterium]
MRSVVQKVKNSKVFVDDQKVGEINKGLLVFLGVEKGDEKADFEYIRDKIIHLRIFEDDRQKMNRSVLDVEGEVLVVSQFTLSGDVRKGRRPSFIAAADPEEARIFYDRMIEDLKSYGLKVEQGVFQAHMEVALINDGPVTILLDSKKKF